MRGARESRNVSDRRGAEPGPPSAGGRRGRGPVDIGAPSSILCDAGAVAAAAIAERPAAWTLVAGGLALHVWERARSVSVVCPSAWLVGAVLVAAVACSAVVRERRGLPVMLAVLAAFAAIVGRGDQPTKVLTVAGAGAIAATLLLHGSPRVLRMAGGIALALGCTFALWRAGWRVAQGASVAGREVWELRLAGFRQEVAIAAGVAMLTPVVRPRTAAAALVGAALVVSIDYVEASLHPVTWFVEALSLLGALTWLASAVRVAGDAAVDRDRAPGRLAGGLQRWAWVGAVSAACHVVGVVFIPGVLHTLLRTAARGDPWWDNGHTLVTWWPVVIGVAAACLGGICARMSGRAPVLRCTAAFAIAALAVAVGEFLLPSFGWLPEDVLAGVTRAAAVVAPAFIGGAAIAAYAPGARPIAVVMAASAFAACALAAGAILMHHTGAQVWRFSGLQHRLVEGIAVLWGAAAALTATLPCRRAPLVAGVVIAALVTELVTRAALALAPDFDIPYAPDATIVAVATVYSLCWIFILRPFCARTPVPEEHPIHHDFDLLGRTT